MVESGATTSPAYSICITHYENLRTLEESLSTILSQIDSRFEVVVVDNLSRDGSFELLSRYEKEGRIRLISAKSSRGKARQIAYEKSLGPCVIAGMDLDDTFLPNLGKVLEEFHELAEDKVLLARGPIGGHLQTVTVAGRRAIDLVGGWRDLHYFEDWDFWGRAAKKSLRLVDDRIILVSNKELHIGRHGIAAIRHQYQKYLSAWLVGYPYPVGKRPRLANWLGALAAGFAYLRSRKFEVTPDPGFWEHDPKFLVESSPGHEPPAN